MKYFDFTSFSEIENVSIVIAKVIEIHYILHVQHFEYIQTCHFRNKRHICI